MRYGSAEYDERIFTRQFAGDNYGMVPLGQGFLFGRRGRDAAARRRPRTIDEVPDDQLDCHVDEKGKLVWTLKEPEEVDEFADMPDGLNWHERMAWGAGIRGFVNDAGSADEVDEVDELADMPDGLNWHERMAWGAGFRNSDRDRYMDDMPDGLSAWEAMKYGMGFESAASQASYTNFADFQDSLDQPAPFVNYADLDVKPALRYPEIQPGPAGGAQLAFDGADYDSSDVGVGPMLGPVRDEAAFDDDDLGVGPQAGHDMGVNWPNLPFSHWARQSLDDTADELGDEFSRALFGFNDFDDSVFDVSLDDDFDHAVYVG